MRKGDEARYNHDMVTLHLPAKLETKDQLLALCRHLMGFGLNFNPDTPGKDYIDVMGARSIDDKDADALDALWDQAFEKWGEDVYDVALQVHGDYERELALVRTYVGKFAERMEQECMRNWGKDSAECWRSLGGVDMRNEIMYHVAKSCFAAREGDRASLEEFLVDTANCAMICSVAEGLVTA